MWSLGGAYTNDICTTNTCKGFQLLTYTYPANSLLSYLLSLLRPSMNDRSYATTSSEIGKLHFLCSDEKLTDNCPQESNAWLVRKIWRALGLIHSGVFAIFQCKWRKGTSWAEPCLFITLDLFSHLANWGKPPRPVHIENICRQQIKSIVS